IRLPCIGRSGVDTLARKRALDIGAGGLGCPLVSSLAASGIGHVGIADGDRVETRNLARQFLYTPSQVGELKTNAAIAYLNTRYLATTFEAYPFFVNAENIHALVEAHDLVVDATDNFRSRML